MPTPPQTASSGPHGIARIVKIHDMTDNKFMSINSNLGQSKQKSAPSIHNPLTHSMSSAVSSSILVALTGADDERYRPSQLLVQTTMPKLLQQSPTNAHTAELGLTRVRQTTKPNMCRPWHGSATLGHASAATPTRASFLALRGVLWQVLGRLEVLGWRWESRLNAT